MFKFALFLCALFSSFVCSAAAETLGAERLQGAIGAGAFDVEWRVSQERAASPALFFLRITGVGSLAAISWQTTWDLSSQPGNTCVNFRDFPDPGTAGVYHWRVSACTNGEFMLNGRRAVGVQASIRYRTDTEGLPSSPYWTFVSQNFYLLRR